MINSNYLVNTPEITSDNMNALKNNAAPAKHENKAVHHLPMFRGEMDPKIMTNAIIKTAKVKQSPPIPPTKRITFSIISESLVSPLA